jgi:hypothetical protein
MALFEGEPGKLNHASNPGSNPRTQAFKNSDTKPRVGMLKNFGDLYVFAFADTLGHLFVPVRHRHPDAGPARDLLSPSVDRLTPLASGCFRIFGNPFAAGTADVGCAVPGRGLEPLRISPPDPKSGASANSATLATL